MRHDAQEVSGHGIWWKYEPKDSSYPSFTITFILLSLCSLSLCLPPSLALALLPHIYYLFFICSQPASITRLPEPTVPCLLAVQLLQQSTSTLCLVWRTLRHTHTAQHHHLGHNVEGKKHIHSTALNRNFNFIT
jgi:hypothetical protein